MNKEDKIYVAGHTGLVGSAIMRKLIQEGYDNIVVRKIDELDLRIQKDVEEFFAKERPDYVFLAAAKVGGILANSTYKAEFIYDNMAIALNVIHASYKYGVKKLLNLGSSCIYPRNCPQPMKEEYLLTGPLEPTNEPYAIAKIAAIKLCRYYNEQYGTNFISVMPTNLYGPNDNFNFETSHVLPALIRKFYLAKQLEDGNMKAIITNLKKYPIGIGLDDEINYSDDESIINILSKIGITIEPSAESVKIKVTLWGTGDVYREFLHVDDLADAVVYLMKNVDADRMREISADFFVNIGTGKDIKIKDLVHMIKEIIKYNGIIDFDITKPDGTPKKLLDVSKLHKLAWNYKIELEEGIIEMLEIIKDLYKDNSYK